MEAITKSPSLFQKSMGIMSQHEILVIITMLSKEGSGQSAYTSRLIRVLFAYTSMDLDEGLGQKHHIV